MNSDEQRHIVGVLRDYRERLGSAREDLGADLDEHAADPIAAQMRAVEARILDVESFLIEDLKLVERRELRNPIRRIHLLTRPRLGRLRQHVPAPLCVPTRYFRTDAPQPAPTIAIVTPSFGQGHFLERTLHSVIDQRYPALEYVVQDGGSTDETVEVLRRYEDSLTHWASEPDGGQGDAINRGFAHTDSFGEIMAYLNSDDLLLPGALAYVAGYFAAHPEVDVVYGHRVIIDEHDRQIGIWVLPRHDDEVLALLDFVPQETLFWRRRAWEAAGGQIDPSLSFAIDWDLLLRLRDSGAKIVRLPRFLGAFRAHDEQKTATSFEQGLAECEALRLRVHGRAVSHDEALARVTPYLRRHVAHHLWHRLKARLPSRYQSVPTQPGQRRVPTPERPQPQAESAGVSGS